MRRANLGLLAIVGLAAVLYRSRSTLPSFPTLPSPSTGAAGLDALAQAIAYAEGYGASPTNAPTRNNNPGDLGGAARAYATAQAGWDALYRQLGMIADQTSAIYDRSMTIADMAAHWTVTEQAAWTANVVASLNRQGFAVDAFTPLDQVLG